MMKFEEFGDEEPNIGEGQADEASSPPFYDPLMSPWDQPSAPVAFGVAELPADPLFPLEGKPWELALRGGYFRSPDNRIRMKRFNSTDDEINAMYRNAFPGGDDSDHLTLGVGLRFGSSSFHLAGETSDERSQIVGSYVLSIGGKRP